MEKVPKRQLQGRKRMRLTGYDYSSDGLYFVTIDCNARECRFGHVHRSKMILNDFGRIAEDEWRNLLLRYKHVRLHDFQIMPNHMHGIIELTSSEFRKSCVEVGLAPTDGHIHLRLALSQGMNQCDGLKSLSDVVGSYKSLVANLCLELHKQNHLHSSHIPLLGKIWKRGFYDNIIRDQASFKTISRYIRDNPSNWAGDINNPTG